ncbi:DnaJ domain-containing protein, partial [Candidatus Gracilibacteria bacterium]|nr:DnaJ domain-containing protein [Candidatus Gracilibacteria bacterium]
HMDPPVRLEGFRYLYNRELLSKEEILSLVQKHMDPPVRLEGFRYLYNRELLSKEESLAFTKHMDPEIRSGAFSYLANRNLLYKREVEELANHYDPELRKKAAQMLANQTDFPSEPQPAPPPSPPRTPSQPPPNTTPPSPKDNQPHKIPPFAIGVLTLLAALGLLAPLSCFLSNEQILQILKHRKKFKNRFSREEKILEDEFLRFARAYMNQQESSHPSVLSAKLRKQRILQEIKKRHNDWIRKDGNLKDLYKILGIDSNATLEEIKKAYWKMVHKTHPDLVGKNNLIIDVNLAHHVLSDPGLSSQYHKYHSELIGG